MPFAFDIGASPAVRCVLAVVHGAAALAVLLLPPAWWLLLAPLAASLWRCDRLQGARRHPAAVVRVQVEEGQLRLHCRGGGVMETALLPEAAICLPQVVILYWRGRLPGWPGTLLVARDAVAADSHRRLRRLIRDRSLRAA